MCAKCRGASKAVTCMQRFGRWWAGQILSSLRRIFAPVAWPSLLVDKITGCLIQWWGESKALCSSRSWMAGARSGIVKGVVEV